MAAVSVVVATRDRRDVLLASLGKLLSLPERPHVIVADNGSRDGTGAAVREGLPSVHVIELSSNHGSAARNVAAEAAATPLIAFADDDSWWAPGSLAHVEKVFDRYPRLGLAAARVLVGPDQLEDPVCLQMSSGLAPEPGCPGRPILGFLACAAVVRRNAFLAAGGFHPRLGVGGEEQLLALDMATAGWNLAYLPEVVAYHYPPARADHGARRRRQARNAVWSAWLRRSCSAAALITLRLLRDEDAAVRAGARQAVLAGSWVLPERRRLPKPLERQISRLDAGCYAG